MAAALASVLLVLRNLTKNLNVLSKRTMSHSSSGVTEGGGAVAPGCSRQGGAKQHHQKYFMTNDHKSEFDTVF